MQNRKKKDRCFVKAKQTNGGKGKRGKEKEMNKELKCVMYTF